MFNDIQEDQFQEIVSLVEELAEFYSGDDWILVKKYILRYSRPETRKNFSTRHNKTKKHKLNKFEIKLINYCESKYNLILKLHDKDKHVE